MPVSEPLTSVQTGDRAWPAIGENRTRFLPRQARSWGSARRSIGALGVRFGRALVAYLMAPQPPRPGELPYPAEIGTGALGADPSTALIDTAHLDIGHAGTAVLDTAHIHTAHPGPPHVDTADIDRRALPPGSPIGAVDEVFWLGDGLIIIGGRRLSLSDARIEAELQALIADRQLIGSPSTYGVCASGRLWFTTTTSRLVR